MSSLNHDALRMFVWLCLNMGSILTHVGIFLFKTSIKRKSPDVFCQTQGFFVRVSLSRLTVLFIGGWRLAFTILSSGSVLILRKGNDSVCAFLKIYLCTLLSAPHS